MRTVEKAKRWQKDNRAYLLTHIGENGVGRPGRNEWMSGFDQLLGQSRARCHKITMELCLKFDQIFWSVYIKFDQIFWSVYVNKALGY